MVRIVFTALSEMGVLGALEHTSGKASLFYSSLKSKNIALGRVVFFEEDGLEKKCPSCPGVSFLVPCVRQISHRHID